LGVAGAYRGGKSFFLNRVILDRKEGFGVGNSINACTKGIWIWNRPIYGSDKEGKPVPILVIDSEGLNAIDVESNHDSRVFSLLLLLSSIFIFNQNGAIDEDSIEMISYIAQLTNHIQMTVNNDNVDYEDYRAIMPRLIWILRDFQLELKDRLHNDITSNEYLENAIKEIEFFDHSDSQKKKNKIRRIIKSLFLQRDCFTLV
jgi:hypothetical protein